MKRLIALAVTLLAFACGDPPDTPVGCSHPFRMDGEMVGCIQLSKAWGFEYTGWLDADPFDSVKGTKEQVKAMLKVMYRERNQ